MITATVTKPRKSKPQPPAVCTLTLLIAGQSYRVRCIPADAFGADRRAYRLRKVGMVKPGQPTHYHVAETARGAECDCGDFTWRHDGRDAAGCKHIRSLRALGLIRPVPAAPPSIPGVNRVRDEFDL